MRNLDLLNISGEQSFVFVMMLVVLVALTLPALTTDVAAQERTRYDLSSIESQIHAEVNKTLTLYMEQGTGAFDVITSVGSEDPNTIFPFVVESATLKIVAHGAGMPYVGQTALTLTEADMTIDHIRAELERVDRVWIKHIDMNPANGRNWCILVTCCTVVRG